MNYTAEYNAMHQLYENPDEAPLAQWGIDYVLFDSYVFSNIKMRTRAGMQRAIPFGTRTAAAAFIKSTDKFVPYQFSQHKQSLRRGSGFQLVLRRSF